jgi:2-(1,2-epoxy-1,2-dihydrophenyl)acetyl-CoA isomerase
MVQLETGTDDLLVRKQDRIAVITFNRPDARNALSEAMYGGFDRVLPQIADDDEIRCVMVTGTGKAFCAGGDVKGMADKEGTAGRPKSVEANVARIRVWQEMVSLALHEFPKPVVGAIPGAAAGAGMSIALSCDVRIMADTAFFTTAFANVGFSGDFGGSWFLTQLVGPGLARELYFSARRVQADEALRLGLANRVAPSDSFEEDALAFANELASGPPIAHRLMKENLNRALHHELRECLAAEAVGMIRTGETEDHQEAARAFVEKRKPVFNGR